MADLLQAATEKLLADRRGSGSAMSLNNGNGKREFPGGKEDWPGAEQAAEDCQSFLPDVEEERVADAARSCYNCRYRRWTAASFTCSSQILAY